MVQQREPVTQVRDELVLDVPPEPAYVSVARLFASSVARHLGFSPESIEDVKIAVSEAVTNAVKAHREGKIAEPIRLVAVPDGDGIIFEIVDAGPGFDVDPSGSSGTLTPPSGLYEGSLGLTLIRSLFPDSRIIRNPERGVTVRFRAGSSNGSGDAG